MWAIWWVVEMPIPLGTNTDDKIDEIQGSVTAGGATQFATRVAAFLRDNFLSTNNVFGTASTLDTGDESGQLPLLRSGGVYNGARFPAASTTGRGVSIREGTAAHTLDTTEEGKHATIAGAANAIGLALTSFFGASMTFAHTFRANWTPTVASTNVNYFATSTVTRSRWMFTPPDGTSHVLGWIIGAGPGVIWPTFANNQISSISNQVGDYSTGVIAFINYSVPSTPLELTVNIGTASRTAQTNGGDTSVFQGSTNLCTAPGGRINLYGENTGDGVFPTTGPNDIPGNSSHTYYSGMGDYVESRLVDASGSALGADLSASYGFIYRYRDFRSFGISSGLASLYDDSTINPQSRKLVIDPYGQELIGGLFGMDYGTLGNDGIAILCGVRGNIPALTIT